jgi:hypothetical protein
MAEKICFSESLYRKEAVTNSVKVYQQLAEFFLSTEEAGVVVSIENIHPELDPIELVDSFCNYVLNETIILSRKESGGAV